MKAFRVTLGVGGREVYTNGMILVPGPFDDFDSVEQLKSHHLMRCAKDQKYAQRQAEEADMFPRLVGRWREKQLMQHEIVILEVLELDL